MVLSPPSKTDLCRTALNTRGVAGALCILSLGTKKFPFKILLVKREKLLFSQNAVRMPGTNCSPKYILKISTQYETLSHLGRGDRTLLSLQHIALVWIAFFPIFEGFLSCLWSQKCRSHGARRGKQEAAKQQPRSLSTHLVR